MIICRNCGHENKDDALLCSYCGVSLLDASTGSTRAFGDTDYEEGDPKWGSARFGTDSLLRIDVLETGQRYVFGADQLEEIVIGRLDPDTGQSPAVDLSESDALKKGVSRRHARLMLREGAVYVQDNGSPNGTFLNGQKIIGDKPRILRDGDDIRLGHLTVRITFLKR